jgi:predicted CoA-binding protein
LKRTVIIGASENPARYAYVAAGMLQEFHHEFVPVGVRYGTVLGKEILDLRAHPMIDNVDTVTLYINPKHQKEWYDYIFKLKPKRVIFNPGTENPELERLLEDQGIHALEACTLVLLRSNQY